MTETANFTHVSYTAFNGYKHEKDYSTTRDAQEKLNGIRFQYGINGFYLAKSTNRDGKLREVWKCRDKWGDMIIEVYQREVTVNL